MILYDFEHAPSPRRARILIAEKGIDLEVRQIDFMGKEQRSEKFLAINPFGTVPVLITDEGETITENDGIAVYLETVAPEPPLLGTTDIEKAQIASWNTKAQMLGFTAAAEHFRNRLDAFKGDGLPGTLLVEQIPELVERGAKRMMYAYEMLDQQLDQREWIASDSYSYADISWLVVTDFAQRMGLKIPEENGNVKAWHQRASARPSAKA